MIYAEDTKVPVSRSQEEIRRVILKYKGGDIATAEFDQMSVVSFKAQNRRLKFVIQNPKIGVPNNRGKVLTKSAQVEKEQRRLWRCLLLLIKSNFEAVESGIVIFEDAFLPFIMLPSGKTVAEEIGPQIEQSYATNSMPPLLGYGV